MIFEKQSCETDAATTSHEERERRTEAWKEQPIGTPGG